VREAKVNGRDLPDASVAYLINFGFQSLQDAYAGADSLAEAEAAFGKKLAALLEGTIGVRAGGGGLTDEDRARHYVADQQYRARYAKDEARMAEYDALEGEARRSRLDEIADKLEAHAGDAFRKLVADRVEYLVEQRKRRAEEKAAIAAMGGGLDL
jgi:hypothetical protein